jgi:hypothetical protein
MHAPNESYRVESLELGERAALELYRSLAALQPVHSSTCV